MAPRPLENLYKTNEKARFWRGPPAHRFALDPVDPLTFRGIPRQGTELRENLGFCKSHRNSADPTESHLVHVNSRQLPGILIKCMGIQNSPSEFCQKYELGPNPPPRRLDPWKTFMKPMEKQGSGEAPRPIDLH